MKKAEAGKREKTGRAENYKIQSCRQVFPFTAVRKLSERKKAALQTIFSPPYEKLPESLPNTTIYF